MPLLSESEMQSCLETVVLRLREAFAPLAIYLFGSYVYGKPGPHSDLDLLVIVQDSALDPYARDALAYRAIGPIGVSKDVQVYTRREFEERSALTVSFERTVKDKGRLLHAA